MKKNILYIILIAYSFNFIKPYTPYISDLVAHTFWYTEHMATVHFENGKYHVHKEAESAFKSNPQKDEDTQKKAFADTDNYTLKQTEEDIFYATPTKEKLFARTASLPLNYSGYTPPPPKL